MAGHVARLSYDGLPRKLYHVGYSINDELGVWTWFLQMF